MQLIAFTGRKGHGKNSAAEPILRIRNQKTQKFIWTEVNFADKVKDVCHLVFDMDIEELYDPVVKEMKLNKYPFETPRSILQRVGTELFRSEWPDVWTQAWDREASKHSHVVVTDLRFQNEYDVIRRLWGTVVRIERPGMSDSDEHQSETEMIGFQENVLILNDGSLEDLEKKVLEIPVVKETL